MFLQSSKMMYYLPTEEKLTEHENRVPIKELQLTLGFVSHCWLLDSFKEIGVHSSKRDTWHSPIPRHSGMLIGT